MSSKKRRRTFLRAALVATAGGLAGCSGGGGSDDEEDEEADTEEDGNGEETEATNGSDGGKDETESEGETDTPTEESMDTPEEDIETDVPEEEVDRTQSFAAALEETRGWLSSTSNFNGNFQDSRSDDSPEVRVGIEANGGNWGFGPPAIRVTTGTRVDWTWTGDGGQHNVVDEAGTFGSGTPESSGGTQYSHTFEETGLYKYKCTVHEDFGMRGAVFVEEEQTLSGYVEVDEWLDDYEFDGRLNDRRNESNVDITVGADGNEGPFAFRPIAILVDPGTTITWDWTGRGGVHDITWEDSDLQDSNGSGSAANTYSLTLDEPGVYLYFCSSHQPTGARGAIVVDDG